VHAAGGAGGVRPLTAIGELAGVVQGCITASQGQIFWGLAKQPDVGRLRCAWVALGGLGRPCVAAGGHLAGSGGLWRAWDGAWRGLEWAPRRVPVGRGACQGRHPAPAPGKSQAPKSIVGIHHPTRHRPPTAPPPPSLPQNVSPQHAARAAKLFGMRGGRGGSHPERASLTS